MFGRWKGKRGADVPESKDDAGQAEESDFTADPRELAGLDGVTVAGSPEAAEAP